MKKKLADMIANTKNKYEWKYCSLGGITRVTITSGEDIAHLAELDQKMWSVLSCPVKGLELDERTLDLIDYDRDGNIIRFLIRRVGPGTEKLSELKSSDTLNVILPLGNGFVFRNQSVQRPLLVGGGVGIAPLLFLGREMKACGIEPTFLFGGREKCNLLRMGEYSNLGRVFATTEDGSFGQKGFVTDHSLLEEEQFDYIFSCGPTPMMKAVAGFASEHGIGCQVSLEHRMACGIGACLCCVEETKSGNVCVCKDGPVFTTDKLLW